MLDCTSCAHANLPKEQQGVVLIIKDCSNIHGFCRRKGFYAAEIGGASSSVLLSTGSQWITF